jgi:hypothetical protein
MADEIDLSFIDKEADDIIKEVRTSDAAGLNPQRIVAATLKVIYLNGRSDGLRAMGAIQSSILNKLTTAGKI